MRRALSVLVVLAAAAGAVVLTGASEESKGKTYWVEFDNAFGLVEGGDLKIGGVRAGTVNKFELTETEPYRVLVQVEVSEPGFDALRSNAECRVRNQSLIGEYYVDCEVGTAADLLPVDGVVPVERTSSSIPPDLIANVMRRPYRERFRLILSELGVGLAGRPEDLNEVIRRAHPALREVTETLAILNRQNETIRDFITDADRVSLAVEPKKEQLSRWAQEAMETAEIQASRADRLQAQWNKLPRFLGELRPTLAQLDATAKEQIPFLERMRAAAPDFHRLLVALEPFANASRGSTRALGEAAVVGRRAFRESAEEIQELRELSEDAPRLAKPLRQFLETIDDRERSVDDDPLHESLAPPAPDKTAAQPGEGFTGMEALMNYVYWQTLGINGFDQVSHFLRIVLLQTDCSAYQNNPDERLIRLCSTGVGPYQPCIEAEVEGKAEGPTSLIHNGKDLCTLEALEDGGAGVGQSASGETVANLDADEGLGRRRARGQPEAPALPGEPDISKPMITLPPQIQELLDGLRKPPTLPDLPNVPSEPDLPGLTPDSLDSDSGPPQALLDYLLAP
ncbi:MAG TPA: MlaD family protein [Thermoleophilaceae bacterium]|nr:MlaD family protein [Thermoleophilaceae bacterium]